MTECADEPTRLLEGWGDADLLVLVDAVKSGAEPGTVHRVEVGEHGLPRELGLTSSHVFGVEETIELARTLGRLPERVVVFGIEAKSLAAGESLTPAVAAAIEPVAEAVRRELGN